MARDVPANQTDATRPREIACEVARLVRSLLGESTEVIWFGSWRRRRALARSDIDLAISTRTPIPPERMALLHDAVDNIATLYQITLWILVQWVLACARKFSNTGNVCDHTSRSVDLGDCSCWRCRKRRTKKSCIMGG
jgi:predicted nucleotidyltransferase